METAVLKHLEIFFGDAHNAAARVYARLNSAPAGCRLAGRVVGPACEYSQTLAASIPFLAKRADDGGESPPLLAEAIVPDPCFWSGELPFLYQAQVELRCGGDLLAAEERTFGIRPLGTRQGRLVFEGKPWVVRAVNSREVPERTWQGWRAADLAMQVAQPDDETCSQASRFGVVLLAELHGNAASLTAELKRLSRWPAVAIAVLSGEGRLDQSIRGAAHNLLLGGYVHPSEGLVSDWADLFVCEHSSAERIAARAAGLTLPVLAQRSAGWRDDLADARRECDLLQRDLAGRGDFAGYLV